MKNPPAAAHGVSGGSSASGISWVRPLPTPLTPSSPTAFRTTPNRTHPSPLRHPPPNSPPFPTDNMHGNLRFYYVQQPCLDYVLFLGFSEVISFSLSDISSGPDALRWRTGEARPPHFPSRSRILKTCIPFSSHVHFSKSYPGGGWGRGSLFVQYGQNQVLIIVDMILSWKNILWFQRVSEHVLELRALWDVWVKGMHYSFWLCGDKKKKHILYVLSFRCSWKYTCIVYFLLLIGLRARSVQSSLTFTPCFVFA